MNKEELIRKIKTLAERGFGGEKENAQKILQDLMRKYDIDETDISDEILKNFQFSMPKFPFAGKLAYQVMYSIVGHELGESRNFWTTDSRKMLIECTTAEFIEFEAKFKFYSYHFKKELDRFYGAFVQANMIFPPSGKGRKNDKRSLNEEDRRLLALARGLEKHDYLMQIEGEKR